MGYHFDIFGMVPYYVNIRPYRVGKMATSFLRSRYNSSIKMSRVVLDVIPFSLFDQKVLSAASLRILVVDVVFLLW